MEQINDILAKHFSSIPLSDDEKLVLDEWKSNHLKEYETLADLDANWSNMSQTEYKEFNTQKAWQKIEGQINEQPEKETQTFTLNPFIKYAIAASVMLAVIFTGIKMFGHSENNYVAFSNTSNQVKTLQLDDGTNVYLAKNTTIEYQEDFANNRNINLDGEAFFDVHRDESHPFIIHTDNSEVEVLGTSFDVNTKTSQTIVSVKSGRVELRNPNQKVILTKNESASSDGTQITPKTTVNPNYLAWKTGEFEFNNTPIDEVVNTLNSYYNTKVVLADKVDKNISFTGDFKQEKLENIIDAITLSCNLQSENKNQQIIIK